MVELTACEREALSVDTRVVDAVVHLGARLSVERIHTRTATISPETNKIAFKLSKRNYESQEVGDEGQHLLA